MYRLIAPITLLLLLAIVVWVAGSRDAHVDQTSIETTGASDAVRSEDPSLSAFPSSFEPSTELSLFDQVTDRARGLARKPYAHPDTVLPDPLAELDYTEYQSIRFRPEAALWRDEVRFEVQLFHRGFLFRKPVHIHVVDDDAIDLLAFDGSRFRYDEPAPVRGDDLPSDLGHAGFRVHYPLHGPESKDEIAVFLGASYFRILGPGQVHGLSSRGLAIDTALDGGEEFPDFREFWLVRPEPDASTFTIYALLDSPSITGAYRFDLEPGSRMEVAVEARLFAREEIRKLGVAPLTSMFLFGPDGARDYDDFRPRVHDSEGLLAYTGPGEWIWRPLSNRSTLQVTSLRDRNPRGFGLVQREREFAQYLDLEAQYHRRPSQWVVPEDDWGEGGVELVEIPTSSEFNDNIVAYWVPQEPVGAGAERRYRYRLTTFDAYLERETRASVGRTRIGWNALPGESAPPPRSHRRFVVDFVGGNLPSDGATAELDVSVQNSSGSVSDILVQPLPEGRGRRVSFLLVPDGDRPVDMRLFLEEDGEPVTETWSYLWVPDAP